MAEILKIIDVDTKWQRVTVLAVHNKQMLFGLGVRRLTAKKQPYWCVYMSLTPDQFQELAHMNELPAEPELSFLSISSDSIMVKKDLCDTLVMDQPIHFVGTHEKDFFTTITDNEALVGRIQALMNHVFLLLGSPE